MSFKSVCLIFIPLTVINLRQLLLLSSSPPYSLKTLTASQQRRKHKDSSFHNKRQKGLVINISTLVNQSFFLFENLLRMRRDKVTWSSVNQSDVSMIFPFRFDIAFVVKFVVYFYVLLDMRIKTE